VFIVVVVVVVFCLLLLLLLLLMSVDVCGIVGYSVGKEPFNLAQQSGSFAVTSVSGTAAAAADDDDDDDDGGDDDDGDDGIQGNKVMTQVVTQPPVDTCRPERMPRPLVILGDFRW